MQPPSSSVAEGVRCGCSPNDGRETGETVQIRTIQPHRLTEAVSVIARAFRDEPIIGQMVAEDAAQRDRKIRDYFAWSIRVTGLSNTDVAIDPLTDRVLGVALWEPPGHRPHTVRGAIALPGALRGIGRSGFTTLKAFGRAGLRKHPEQPHWHLVDVGTCPSARGRGVGAALVRHRLECADRDQRIVSLEATTEGSARLYERLGFERRDRLVGVADGVTVMWREPDMPSAPRRAGGAAL